MRGSDSLSVASGRFRDRFDQLSGCLCDPWRSFTNSLLLLRYWQTAFVKNSKPLPSFFVRFCKFICDYLDGFSSLLLTQAFHLPEWWFSQVSSCKHFSGNRTALYIYAWVCQPSSFPDLLVDKWQWPSVWHRQQFVNSLQIIFLFPEFHHKYWSIGDASLLSCRCATASF